MFSQKLRLLNYDFQTIKIILVPPVESVGAGSQFYKSVVNKPLVSLVNKPGRKALTCRVHPNFSFANPFFPLVHALPNCLSIFVDIRNRVEIFLNFCLNFDNR